MLIAHHAHPTPDWPTDVVQAVWAKGEVIPGRDPTLWRRDAVGLPIRRDLYEETESRFGWVVDRVRPLTAGGTSDLDNLQPLQWDEAYEKADKWPWKPPPRWRDG